MSLQQLVEDVICGRRDPSELTPGLWDLWAHGFHAGAGRVRSTALARAEFDADYWYFEANNPDAARERRKEATSTVHLDVEKARRETAARLAALDAAERKAS